MERKKWKHTEETKRKMSETAKRIVNKGHFQKGFKVLRLWEPEINNMNIDDLKSKLTQMEIIEYAC